MGDDDHPMAQPIFAGVDLASFARPIVINLPERTGRLADALTELSGASGRPVEVGDDVEVIHPARFTEPGGFANPAYRSNLDAHLRAACLARALGREQVLVVEDDLAFNPLWSTWGAGLLASLADQPWQIANLGYLDEWGEAPTEPDQALPGSLAVNLDGIGLARFTGRINGSHAYLLHHSVLDAWIDHLTTILHGEPGDDLRGPMSSDGAINTYFWIHHEQVRLVATPNLVGTRPTRSDITPGRLDRLPLVGDAVEVARRLNRRRQRASVINYR